jgi:hypothetical protein
MKIRQYFICLNYPLNDHLNKSSGHDDYLMISFIILQQQAYQLFLLQNTN